MIPAAYRLCFGMFRLILAVLVIILGVLFSCYDDTSYHTTGSTYNETADRCILQNVQEGRLYNCCMYTVTVVAVVQPFFVPTWYAQHRL